MRRVVIPPHCPSIYAAVNIYTIFILKSSLIHLYTGAYTVIRENNHVKSRTIVWPFISHIYTLFQRNNKKAKKKTKTHPLQ